MSQENLEIVATLALLILFFGVPTVFGVIGELIENIRAMRDLEESRRIIRKDPVWFDLKEEA